MNFLSRVFILGKFLKSLAKMLFSKSFTALAVFAAEATATIFYAGVAESSGEFGVWSMPIPSVHFGLIFRVPETSLTLLT